MSGYTPPLEQLRRRSTPPHALTQRLVTELERPPSHRLKVFRGDGGTTRVIQRHRCWWAGWLLVGPATAALSVAAVVMTSTGGLRAAVAPTALLLLLGVAFLRCITPVEEISLNPLTIVRASAFTLRRTDIVSLADVSTFVVIDCERRLRLYLQAGRERIPVAQSRFNEAQLRWLARRLRLALDEARAHQRRA